MNWNPLYKEKLKNLRTDLESGIKEYEELCKDKNIASKISRNNDNVIQDQEVLISSFNGKLKKKISQFHYLKNKTKNTTIITFLEMIKSLKEEKNIILQKLYEFVEKVTIKTSDVIEDLNKKQASNNNLLNLQNEVNKLKVEKEELEKKYK